MPSAIYAKRRKIGLHAKCHYAECRYADCHGADKVAPLVIFLGDVYFFKTKTFIPI